MQRFNITEAAKAADRGRSSIYRDIKEGRVRVEHGADGQPYIELGELLRAYGPLKEPGTPRDIPAVQLENEDVIHTLKAENSRLQRELEETREESKAREMWFREQVDKQTRLLTYIQEEQAPHPKTNAPPQEPPPHPAVEELKEQVNKLTKQNKYINYQLHMNHRTWWEKLIGKKYVKPEKVPSD